MEISPALSHYLQAVPKAELHVHLEGAIQPATMIELARRNRVPLPAESVEELRRSFIFPDFDHFIESFLLGVNCLKTGEDFEQIVYELGAQLARQNVRYAEVTVTPSTHHRRGISHEIYFAGMQRGQ